MRINRRVVIPAVVVLALSLAGAGIYLRINGQKKDDASSGAPARSGDAPAVSAGDAFSTDLAVAVEGAAVVKDTLVLTVSAAGEARSWRQTVVRAQVAGQVRRVRVDENHNVGEGTVLIEMDPTEYELTQQEAQARLREAEARYREATLGDDRIDDARVRAERDSAARARSGLDGTRVAVARAEINLRRTRVVAPFAGRVANLKIVAGQNVAQGEELLTIQAMDPIRVEAQVLEGDIGFLAQGRRAAVTFAAFPGEVFEGRIETINPVVEQQTRTARVSISVRNAQGRILPGMYARASLSAQRFPDRILVPRDAVIERDNHRTLVFVYEGEGSQGRAKWRYVTTGLQNDRYFEIVENPDTEMVEPGEIVLTAGHHTLQHDIAVRLVDNAAKAEGARPR